MAITKITEVHGIEATELLERFNELDNKFNHILKCLSQKPDTDLLTRQEVAEIFGISLVTLHKWTKKSIIKAYKIGNKVRFKKSEVLEALKVVSSERTVY